MIPLSVTPDMELAPWRDLQGNLPHQGPGQMAEVRRIGFLRHGTQQGRGTVALDIVLPDGTHVLAETTWRLYATAFRALAASPAVAEEDF